MYSIRLGGDEPQHTSLRVATRPPARLKRTGRRPRGEGGLKLKDVVATILARATRTR